MESDSGRTTSVWMATGDVPAFESLNGDTSADVCAGIAGLTVGYLLAREGRKVLLIDDGAVAGGEYARENLNVAAQYADYLTGGEVSSPDEVAPGTGAIMRRGLTKVALYRDDTGTLHEHSAVCIHLGCVVAFNDQERSWDCPCYGSRFEPTDGHVINGPAIHGLETAEERT